MVDAVASIGNIQGAADLVGISQPAATHSVAEIEKLLGFPLFERHAKGARPTPAGEAVLPKIRAALAAFAECADIASDIWAGSQSELRLGAIDAAIGSFLPDAIARFTSRLPATAVHVSHASPERLVQQLADGTIDLLFIRRPTQLPAHAVFEALASDRYAVVCAAGHPAATLQLASRDLLSTFLWLMPPKGSIAEADFLAFWSGSTRPRDYCWVASRAITLAVALIAKRQALAFVPRNLVLPYLTQGSLTEVRGDWTLPMAPIGALYRPDTAARSSQMQVLLEIVRGIADV
ncbi:transcriptional regulator, LysR family [Piscinibacter sakaiensis]|uniref:Transcriptional regulator, LysR family n=1 Tax=Piscinibacter sakaiensis TaxID=1547922 RepID=A0A0K8P5E0_PISS1|nr:transcriptional regulator, LysR family [Piscinibacter sakaiensis]